MMFGFSTSQFLGFALFICLFLSCKSPSNSVLNIAVAANVQFPISKIKIAFEEKTNIPCNIILNSSGRIFAQIVEGAPYDLFLSANTDYPARLHEKELTTQAPIIYATGKLILLSLKDSNALNIDYLKMDQINKIAIANPRFAPYGIATKEALEKLNLFKILEDKLVRGESVSQANQFLFSGAADIAFTSKSTIFSDKLDSKLYWKEIDQALYSKIDQAFVTMKNSKAKQTEIKAFQDFLLSEEAKKIFQDFGYGID